MRIILFEIEVDIWPGHHTFLVRALHFDWPTRDASLLELGWYQGRFQWDLLFLWVPLVIFKYYLEDRKPPQENA